MDRISLPGDDLNEVPDIGRDNCNRFDITGSTALTDQYANALGVAPSTRLLPLEGRPDIDLAIVEALRYAVASDRGPRMVADLRELDA